MEETRLCRGRVYGLQRAEFNKWRTGLALGWVLSSYIVVSLMKGHPLVHLRELLGILNEFDLFLNLAKREQSRSCVEFPVTKCQHRKWSHQARGTTWGWRYPIGGEPPSQASYDSASNAAEILRLAKPRSLWKTVYLGHCASQQTKRTAEKCKSKSIHICYFCQRCVCRMNVVWMLFILNNLKILNLKGTVSPD